jgi:phosphoglycolate phosphatase-like HAD superfamily hydrolase
VRAAETSSPRLDNFQSTDPYLRVLDPAVVHRLGHIRHALFDFDGTLSLLRQGWEEVMVPLMLECINAGSPPLPDIEAEVRAYVDRSTGILTIKQMEWLVQAVKRYGLAGQPDTPAAYKARYVERLHAHIESRIASLKAGECPPESMMVAGAMEFISRLAVKNVTFYLASGSDHPDVVEEAALLGLEPFFRNRIYGALDESEAHDKARIIQRILNDNDLHGAEMLVVGDGPVEIIEARARAAITLGVASDEIARLGWNERKVQRLTAAGADLLVSDFSQAAALIEFLFL